MSGAFSGPKKPEPEPKLPDEASAEQGRARAMALRQARRRGIQTAIRTSDTGVAGAAPIYRNQALGE